MGPEEAVANPAENSASTRRLSPPWGNEEHREGEFADLAHVTLFAFVCCSKYCSSFLGIVVNVSFSLSERSYDLLILYREHSSEEHKIKKILPQRFYVFLSIFYTTPKKNIDIQFP